MPRPDLETFLAAHPALAHVELVLIDPNGVARGKWAPATTLEKAFAEGVNFPLSLHGLDVWGNEVDATGLHISSGDLDGFCTAVPTSLSAVPWGGAVADEAQATIAQVLLETRDPDGQAFGGCARTVLARAVERLTANGLHAVCAFEIEFHLMNADGELVGADLLPDAQRMYGLRALSEQAGIFADIRRAAAWAGLPVDTIVKEAGPGQFEVNLTHRNDALRAADDVVLLKRIVRECAVMHGLTATFMAKPVIGQPGNGLHIHTSLLNDAGDNVFAGEGATRQRHAVAGLLATLADTTLVFVNTINGFRRMAPGSYAPTRANWGENNRSVAIRIPAAPPKAARIEHRVSGADANPYLVLACILTGMAEGMERAGEPAPALTGNAYDPTTANRGEALPNSFEMALEAFAGSAFAARALGETMHTMLVAIKRAELAGFADDISPLERRTYL